MKLAARCLSVVAVVLASCSEELVAQSNRPPVLEVPGTQLGPEGRLLQFTVSATDPDDDAVALSMSELPEGATFEAATGKFLWVPGRKQAGSYGLRASATDNRFNP